MVWSYTLISVLLVSLISLVGLLSLALNEAFFKKILLLLVSFSAGALLGDAFIHIIPEATIETGFTIFSSIAILSGMVTFLILEKFVFWHHCHNGNCKHHPFAYMNLIGDGMHNFIDGAIIAASYLADIRLGVTTTIAVLLHEIPQEMGDFGVLVHGGYTKKKAILMNLLSALMAVVGAVIVLLFGKFLINYIDLLLLFTAGGFIYIASADLIPEINRHYRGWALSSVELLFFLLGMVVMLILLVVG